MTLDRPTVRRLLENFDLRKLFIEELGWDHPHIGELVISLEGFSYHLVPVAHKRGLVVYACEETNVPNHSSRQKIERQVTKSSHEHIIVYANRAHEIQIWQWTRREPGKAAVSRQHTYFKGHSGESLIQKLDTLSFELGEEDDLSITTVANRTRQAFDVDQVTKRFYVRFQNEHSAFLNFVSGIKSKGDREWYASLMLNRLMFVYFIQKKGFLDNDTNYLRTRLRMTRDLRGEGNFHSFYRYFLLRLFHEGLGGSTRSPELDALLGTVPYLNGGLFDVHALEVSNSTIDIPDEAFENVFDFFDAYNWHLDQRPLHSDSEINPDILGYIFEKYINQKEMGAYYTKEDITGYIASNTIIPALFDLAQPGCEVAFESDSALWRLISIDPDRYIHESMRIGMELSIPLDIEEGLNDVSKRTFWSNAVPRDQALPSESWREYMDRRRRYLDLVEMMSRGAVIAIDDLVTRNLNVQQFAQDAIDNCEGPELLRSMYDAICKISVLDPTCGSGAFLFAALNVLEPLYESCLDRMERFIDESDANKQTSRIDKYVDFKKILGQIQTHPSRQYFILKSIILNNLFGVDIMEEAVEICKLRLFLKLVSQVDKVEHIEPLPDIDFNIQSGNSLVGFSTYDEVAEAIASTLDFDNVLELINDRAEKADQAFQLFRDHQTSANNQSGDATISKGELREILIELSDQLDIYLAKIFGAESDVKFWKAKSKPFHWFLNFYGAIKRGGFDVIIGNPPYVEYRKIKDQYAVVGFSTLPCGDLYNLVMERSIELQKSGGRMGMIVPVSITGTDGFGLLRKILLENSDLTCIQSFAERPSKLFTGVDKRLSIWLMRHGQGNGKIYTSNYRRWFAEEREHLFATAVLEEISNVRTPIAGALPKIRNRIEVEILKKLSDGQPPIENFLTKTSSHVLYYTRKVRYFVQFFLSVPLIRNSKNIAVDPTELKSLAFTSSKMRDTAAAALNSNLFFWFFSAFSDVRNVNSREILSFPFDLDKANDSIGSELGLLTSRLMQDFESNSVMSEIHYKKYGLLTIQSFRPRLSKPIIDSIDLALASFYGMTEEEVDFIVNFDVKYRLGVVSDD